MGEIEQIYTSRCFSYISSETFFNHAHDLKTSSHINFLEENIPYEYLLDEVNVTKLFKLLTPSQQVDSVSY